MPGGHRRTLMHYDRVQFVHVPRRFRRRATGCRSVGLVVAAFLAETLQSERRRHVIIDLLHRAENARDIVGERALPARGGINFAN